MNVLRVFFSLEMRENLVREKQARVLSGHGTPETGEKMQLAEHTGERGFATLVRARYDNQALGSE